MPGDLMSRRSSESAVAPHSAGTGPGLAPAGALPLASLAPDATEVGVLSIARHFLTSLADPGTQAWQHAFAIATERWGATEGPRLAMALFAVLQPLLRARPVPFRHCDPLCPEQRNFVTPEEAALIRMIRAMTCDLTHEARQHLAAVTGGRMDPGLIRAGLALARLLPRPTGRPVLVAAHRGLARVH